MIRRSLSALLIAGTVASGAMLAAPADAAPSGGTCTLNLPRRIVVDDVIVTRTASASGDCTKAEAEALWTTDKVFNPDQDEDADFTTAGLALYERGGESHQYGRDAVTLVLAPNAKWGITTFYPALAGRGCDEDGTTCKVTYVQNAPTTDIRLASRSVLKAKRAKGVVTLSGTGSVYSATRLTYKPRIVNALFQSRAKGGAWQTIRTVKTTYKGRATTSVRAAKGTQFRFVTQSAAHWWTSVSKGVTS